MGPVDEAKQMFTLDCYLRQVKKKSDEIHLFVIFFRGVSSITSHQYWTDSRLSFNSKHITELTLNWQVGVMFIPYSFFLHLYHLYLFVFVFV